jgi:hypothetical protein
MRAFIFSVWVHSGKTSNATLAALETLAAKQFTVAEQGGRQVVSAAVQGKAFSYAMPEGQTGADFLQMAHQSWRTIKIGGASNGQMTDIELEDYLSDAGGQETNRTVASFAQYIR